MLESATTPLITEDINYLSEEDLHFGKRAVCCDDRAEIVSLLIGLKEKR
jgi:hypothetical protein